MNVSLKFIPDERKKLLTIYLIIDDTLQSKFDKNFDCYDKLLDHTNKNGSNYLNGHCFVCLAIAIPILHDQKIQYIKFPIHYRIYDKSKMKLELASEMILSVDPALAEYQVMVTCDS